jgi:hypothetical protein
MFPLRVLLWLLRPLCLCLLCLWLYLLCLCLLFRAAHVPLPLRRSSPTVQRASGSIPFPAGRGRR